MADDVGHDRRTAILEGALDLFARHGYAGAGMRAIARTAGIREATLYHYFPTKEALMEALVARYEQAPGHFRQFIPSAVTLQEMLFVAGMAFLHAMAVRENERFLRLMLVEAHHHAGWAREYLTRVYEPPIRALTDALTEAGAGRARWVAESFVGALLSYLIHHRFLPGEDDDLDVAAYVAWLAAQGERGAADDGADGNAAAPARGGGRALPAVD